MWELDKGAGVINSLGIVLCEKFRYFHNISDQIHFFFRKYVSIIATIPIMTAQIR
jgi:hypothetical protein